MNVITNQTMQPVELSDGKTLPAGAKIEMKKITDREQQLDQLGFISIKTSETAAIVKPGKSKETKK